VEPESSSRPRLLVIDDDADTREVLAIELEELGYDVRSAGSGEEGIAIAREWAPSVVVCDLGLPGIDGCETARRLRELGIEGLRLVALTGFDSEEDRERIREAGFDAHVVKGAARFPEAFEKAVPRVVRTKGTGG
jgi:CheY-like chemotaxis protein